MIMNKNKRQGAFIRAVSAAVIFAMLFADAAFAFSRNDTPERDALGVPLRTWMVALEDSDLASLSLAVHGTDLKGNAGHVKEGWIGTHLAAWLNKALKQAGEEARSLNEGVLLVAYRLAMVEALSRARPESPRTGIEDIVNGIAGSQKFKAAFHAAFTKVRPEAAAVRGAIEGTISSFEHERMRAFLKETKARSEENRLRGLERQLKAEGFLKKGDNFEIYKVFGLHSNTGYYGHYAIRDGVVYIDSGMLNSPDGMKYLKHEIYELREIRRYASRRRWDTDKLLEWLDYKRSAEEVQKVLLDIHRRAPRLPSPRGETEKPPADLERAMTPKAFHELLTAVVSASNLPRLVAEAKAETDLTLIYNGDVMFEPADPAKYDATPGTRVTETISYITPTGNSYKQFGSLCRLITKARGSKEWKIFIHAGTAVEGIVKILEENAGLTSYGERPARGAAATTDSAAEADTEAPKEEDFVGMLVAKAVLTGEDAARLRSAIEGEARALYETLRVISASSIQKKRVILAYDTALGPEARGAVQAGEAAVNRYLNDTLIEVRSSGRSLLEGVQGVAADLKDKGLAEGKDFVVVTITGQATLDQIGQDKQKDLGRILKVVKEKDGYLPVIGLYDLALKIGHDLGEESVLRALNSIATRDDKQPFTAEDLKKGIITILPKIGRIDYNSAAEAYRAAQAVLCAL